MSSILIHSSAIRQLADTNNSKNINFLEKHESDNDPLVEPSLRDMLKRTYPFATIHTFHGMGHFTYLSNPDEYTHVIESFLNN